MAVNSDRTIRNIALTGFMGVGKSSVGRALAEQLHFEFLDTDEVIETNAGKSISRIFSEEGEPTFRALECQLVQQLAGRDRLVISTGGGLAVNADNLASLKAHALVVCLWASPEAIWERVRHQSHRPILQTVDPPARIRELLAQREPFYKQADVLVNTELRSLREVVQQVLFQFQLARQPGR